MRAPIFLTGMMASGKSTVGRLLAHELGATFVDLDARVERMFGRTVAQLFEEGERRFRVCEGAALRALVAEPGFAARRVVVATGGGVVLDDGNRDLMASVGTIVFLDVPPEVLSARLHEGAGEVGRRPLLAGDNPIATRRRLVELLAVRGRAYLDRSVRIDGRGEPDAVAARVLEVLSPPETTDSGATDRDSEAV